MTEGQLTRFLDHTLDHINDIREAGDDYHWQGHIYSSFAHLVLDYVDAKGDNGYFGAEYLRKCLDSPGVREERDGK